MRRLAPHQDIAVAAPSPRLAPLLAVFALLVLAAAFAAYFAVARSAASHRAGRESAPVKVANLDRSAVPWLLPTPARAVPRATDRPAIGMLYPEGSGGGTCK